MQTDPLPGMAEAMRLTRLGRLAEATALIRSTLGSGHGATAPAPAPPAAGEAGDTIDGTWDRVDPPAPGGAEADRPATTATPARRSRLGETLRRLRTGMPPMRSPATVPPPPVPEGASFDRHTHAGPGGSRDYRLYVPAGAGSATGPLPLVVMLHGCTQTPEDFATGTGMNALAEAFGCLVAYPAQPAEANANRCWNWFRPDDQARGRGEPALVAGIVGDIAARHPVDPARVFVAGLSAGGAAAAVLGARYPELFAGVGVHSGLPVGAARDMPSAFAAMRQGAAGDRLPDLPPTIVIHGDADATVHPDNGAAVLVQAIGAQRALRAVTETGRAPGGRDYLRTRHADAAGRIIHERWQVSGAGHAWAGGSAAGSHTDPTGPDASRAMLRFFLQVGQPAGA